MQRLFSTFPNSWPGGGVLILRCVVAIHLFLKSALYMQSHQSLVIAIGMLAFITATCLLVGFATLVSSAVQIALDGWCALSMNLNGECLVLVFVGTSLLMLGPGAWSIDAALFGRRRIDLSDL